MDTATRNDQPRNVNWDSPIKVHFEVGSPSREELPRNAATLRRRRNGTSKGDDDGFESLNGKSSSGDESHLSEQLRTTGDDVSLVSDLPTEVGVEEGPPEVPPKPLPSVVKGKGDHSDTDEEREDENDLNFSSPGRNSSGAFTEGTNSNGEWCGVTTNSEECSYSSDLEQTDSQDFAPTVILNSNCGAMDRSEYQESV